jgi:NitT/TauT family transport system substrate-binding protein
MGDAYAGGSDQEGNGPMKKLLAVSVLSIALAAPASAADKVIFQANWLIQGENAYMIAGREKGFYAEQGIDLEVPRGFGSGDTVRKVMTGAALVGTADSGVVMLAALQEGLPLKCIAAEYTYSPSGFFALEASGVKSPKDLIGRKVGITPGNSLQMYFPLIAKANGFDPAGVTFVNMEGSALIPALLAGAVDAIPGFATVYELRNNQAKAQGKPMVVLPMARHGLKVYGECQFTTVANIEKNADLLQRYMRATQKSLRWSKDNPAETARILSSKYPELPEADVVINHVAFMDFVFNETSDRVGLGGFDLEQLKATFDALRTAQKIEKTADVATFIDTRFLK